MRNNSSGVCVGVLFIDIKLVSFVVSPGPLALRNFLDAKKTGQQNSPQSPPKQVLSLSYPIKPGQNTERMFQLGQQKRAFLAQVIDFYKKQSHESLIFIVNVDREVHETGMSLNRLAGQGCRWLVRMRIRPSHHKIEKCRTTFCSESIPKENNSRPIGRTEISTHKSGMHGSFNATCPSVRDQIAVDYCLLLIEVKEFLHSWAHSSCWLFKLWTKPFPNLVRAFGMN